MIAAYYYSAGILQGYPTAICYQHDAMSFGSGIVDVERGKFAAAEDLSILEDIGNWLSTNGEAIYRSRPWRYASEGPTQEVEGQFSDGSATEYTGSDFRFTAGNGCIYATCLHYPEDGQINIKSLAKSKDPNKPAFHGIITDVDILGFEEKPEFCIDENGLWFATKTIQSAFPVVLKIHTD